jgi:hypothetical protein
VYTPDFLNFPAEENWKSSGKSVVKSILHLFVLQSGAYRAASAGMFEIAG